MPNETCTGTGSGTPGAQEIWIGSTSVSAANTTWFSWTAEGGATVISDGREAPLLTPEQVVAGEILRERCRAEATANAKALLVAHLTLEQREMLDKQSAIIVETETRRYRLRLGWVQNVDELDKDGKRLGCFCIHPSVSVPAHDNLLAQKLMLETDEDAFRRIANRVY